MLWLCGAFSVDSVESKRATRPEVLRDGELGLVALSLGRSWALG